MKNSRWLALVLGTLLSSSAFGTFYKFKGSTSGTSGGGGSGDALTTNPLSQFAATTSLQLKGVLSDETGSGAACFATSPTLVTPNLGIPSAGVLTNATGLPISTGVSGLGTGVGTFLATPTSANLAATLTDETGSGAACFATSPTLVTPDLGTPSAAVLTNATGLPISSGVTGLGTGVGTFLATPTSANLAAALTNETGSGAAVFGTSPTLVTPALGTPSALVLTNATGLPLTSGVTGVLPIANMATGTPDGTKFVRDDGTLVTPTGLPAISSSTNGKFAGNNGSAASWVFGYGSESIANAFFPYTMSSTDKDFDTILLNKTSGTGIITLPSASTYANKRFTFVHSASNGGAVQLSGVTGTTVVLTNQYDSAIVKSDGTSWYLEALGRQAPGGYVVTNSSNLSIDPSNSFIQTTVGASTITDTLPTAVDLKGWEITVMQVDSGAGSIQMATTSSQTINGAAASGYTIQGQWKFIKFRSNGANWLVTNDGRGAAAGLISTYLGYGDAGGLLTGASDLTWDATNKILHLDRAAASTGTNLIQFSHGTNTGTTSTDGVIMGYPTGNSHAFKIEDQETGSGGFTLKTGCDTGTCFTLSVGGTNVISSSASSGTTFQSPGASNQIFLAGAGSRVVIGSASDLFRALLSINGNMSWGVSRVSANATISTTSSGTISMDSSGGAKTVTLAGVSSQTGVLTTVHKSDTSTNLVSALRAGSDTLNYDLTQADIINRGESLTIQSDGGTNNIVVADTRAAPVVSIATNTTLTPLKNEIFVECNATSAGGDVTLTLFAVANHIGWKVILVNIGSANNCVLDPNSTEQVWVAGTSGNTDSLAPGASGDYYANGTLWRKH